ncbi:MAG: hypothetical protein IKI97_12735 [Clostridia bacterium]|nr:hypothetical protein [Clostridia bacterium]
MRIKYYGTSAAEGFPGIFCQCSACKRARKRGGKNIRTRSQSAIDERLLIDMCPDTYMHIINYGLDLTKIKSVLITHSHFDHFDPDVFACFSGGMAKRRTKEKVDVYGGKSAIDRLSDVATDRINLHLVKEYTPFEVNGYRIIPIPAQHSSRASSYNYIISKRRKTILYGHDTGIYTQEIYDFIRESKIKFDLLSLDCTYGVKHKDNCDHHMNLDAVKSVVDKFRAIGAVKKNAVVIANHFTHFCENTYDELCKITKGSGVTVSFDGMEVEI